MSENNSETKALIDFAQNNAGFSTGTVQQPQADSAPYAVVPQGKRLESLKPLLDAYRTAPERRKGTSKHTTVESLIAHANDYKDANSVIFVNEGENPSITAIYNYNKKGGDYDGGQRFGDHKAVYAFPLSDAWKEWTDQSGEPLDQLAFANFIEDHILDLMAVPSDKDKTPGAENIRAIAEKLGLTIAGPEKILTLARGISVHENSKAVQIHNTTTGEMQVEFKSEHADAEGQRFTPPGLFLIGVPVFDKGAVYRIPVRLKYRLRGGAISWTFEVLKEDDYLADAIKDSVEMVGQQTLLTVYKGSPEA